MPYSPLNGDVRMQLQDVSFDYRGHVALEEFTTEFVAGVTGILGPNGAGKSTLLRLIAGLALPSMGTIHHNGSPVGTRAAASTLRESVGYLPQDPRWFGEATVYELVRYFAVSRLGRSDATSTAIDNAIAAVDLTKQRHDRLRQLSGGQSRRAFLAQSIVHNPSILVLDEPTAGLDPLQRVRLREHVMANSDGRIVIWATHIVDDLVSLADQVIVLDEGHLVWAGSPKELEELGDRASGDQLGRGTSAGERGFLNALANSSSRRTRE